ncbi:MAG TPA: protein kinase [Candidatus Heimdallarchaeota archaeon]|nr:protein kinase [Candidatus Heimdallarchaeota archaeon]
MSVKCPACDTYNTQDSQFCKNCAAPLASAEDAEITRTKTLEVTLEELTSGSTFANRYQIIEELGKGGMGKVYRALDKKLNEEVALKLVKPEIASDEKTVERFRNELRLARKISHRNVGRMYELMEYKGVHYITMEYVPGQDLRSLIRQTGKLTTETALSIAKEVCEGLSEAHRLGVVHRDLKPSNILVDRQGDAKIMDFGIARSLKSKGITGTRHMIGTPEYMSPEQVDADDDIDQRSDIYSLGVILYEMLTGRVPFGGDTPLSVAYKHKNKKPPNPREFNAQITDELSVLVLKCLEKDKEARYQSAGEVRSLLEGIEKGLLISVIISPQKKPLTSKEITVQFRFKRFFIPIALIILLTIGAIAVWQLFLKKSAASLSSRKPIIAVLPFSDLSPQKDQAYFCDGMTDEIITKLSRLQEWKVMNKTSVMQYKNTDKNIKDIGRELGVTSILEGSIRKEEDNIRITAQLISVEDGFHLWSEIYDRKLERIFAIQNDIAENIVDALKQKLTPEEKQRLQKKTTENIEAYNLYLQGRYYWGQRTREAMPKSVEQFHKAIEIDPNYALAYSGLADCYIAGGGRHLDLSAEEAYAKAREAAQKALELDETLAEAHNSLAGVLTSYFWFWERAENEFIRAIELNPSYATARIWYAEHLYSIGRHDVSIQQARLALELDPLSSMISTALGVSLYFGGEYDQAIQQYQRTLTVTPNFQRAIYWLGFGYIKKEMYRQGIEQFKLVFDLSGDSVDLAALGYAYAVAGQRNEAEEVLRQLEELATQRYVSPVDLAMLHVGLDNNEQAIEYLEKAYEEHADRMSWIKVNPVFDPLRSDPRFQAILQRMNFPE